MLINTEWMTKRFVNVVKSGRGTVITNAKKRNALTMREDDHLRVSELELGLRVENAIRDQATRIRNNYPLSASFYKCR